MKILVLNGFNKEDRDQHRVMRAMREKVKAPDSIEEIYLCDKNIGACKGCFGCWIKTPGECIYKDDAPALLKKIISSDVIVWFTPVVFGGFSSELKKLIDKCICLISPLFIKLNKETHHGKRYDSYPVIWGLGIMKTQDEEAENNFKELIFRNSLNFHCPHQAAEVLYREDSDMDATVKVSKLISTSRGAV